MEKLITNECFEILQEQLKQIMELNQKFQKTIDKEIENTVEITELSEVMEKTLQMKTESIEQMKQIVDELNECSK